MKETIDNCLHEAMDLDGLQSLLEAIRDGQIRTVAIDTPEPSPFSHEILNANPYAYLDDAPLEERRARAVQMRRTLPADYADGAGALDPEAIAQVAAEAWPPMRDADELHEALCDLTPDAVVPPAAVLLRAGRRPPRRYRHHRRPRILGARRAHRPGPPRLPAGRHRSAHRRARWHPPHSRKPRSLRRRDPARLVRMLRPAARVRTSRESLAMPRELVDQALAQLEAEGQILRGQFHLAAAELEWCHRRLLARIHRLTIGRLRREIEPVTTAEFFAFLNRWQHLAPGSQLHGVDGTLQIIRQLQGYEFPAAAWESEVLPRRVARYEPDYLDQLCLSGEVSWGRLSPHPAFEREEDDRKSRRVRPTRVAPLAIFLREDAPWLLATPQPSPEDSLSHPGARGAGAFWNRAAPRSSPT